MLGARPVIAQPYPAHSWGRTSTPPAYASPLAVAAHEFLERGLAGRELVERDALSGVFEVRFSVWNSVSLVSSMWISPVTYSFCLSLVSM